MGLLDDAKFARIEELVSGSVLAAVGQVTETKPGGNTLQIPERLWPDPATVDYGILGDLSELDEAEMLDHADLANMETEKVKLWLRQHRM